MHLCINGLKLPEIQGPSVRLGTRGEELWGVGHGGCPGSWEQSTPHSHSECGFGGPWRGGRARLQMHGPRTFLEAVWEGTALGRALGFVPSLRPAVGVKIERKLKKKEKLGGWAF